MSVLDHVIYALLWISFGAGHSLLAHPPVRRWIAARVGGAERLTYNLIATLHIVVVLAVGLILSEGGAWDIPLWGRLLQGALALIGIAVLVAGMREYDAGRFLGIWQLRHGVRPDEEDAGDRLVTAGLHRYVRHPLYSGGLALLWGVAQSDFGLATAIWGSIYFVIGTWFEERKLLQRFGQAYRDYQSRVPAFLPWKGRAI